MSNNSMTEELNSLRDFLINKNYKCWDTKYDEFPNVNMITQNYSAGWILIFPIFLFVIVIISYLLMLTFAKQLFMESFQ